MKPVKFFMFDGCPHCAQASKFLDQLKQEHPEFTKVEVQTIDEKLQPEVANAYDYYYVPTFFVGEEKVHEGTIRLEDVQKVFEKVLEA